MDYQAAALLKSVFFVPESRTNLLLLYFILKDLQVTLKSSLKVY